MAAVAQQAGGDVLAMTGLDFVVIMLVADERAGHGYAVAFALGNEPVNEIGIVEAAYGREGTFDATGLCGSSELPGYRAHPCGGCGCLRGCRSRPSRESGRCPPDPRRAYNRSANPPGYSRPPRWRRLDILIRKSGPQASLIRRKTSRVRAARSVMVFPPYLSVRWLNQGLREQECCPGSRHRWSRHQSPCP